MTRKRSILFLFGLMAVVAGLLVVRPVSALAGSGDDSPCRENKEATPATAKHGESETGGEEASSCLEIELREVKEALQAQQLRIEALEAELRLVRNSPLPATAPEPVIAKAPTMAAPPQDGLEKRLENAESRLKSLGPFSFSGDFRLRDEPFIGGPANQSQVRNRERFRLRVNASVRLNEDISGGLALATGDINDPITSNQTANQYYTRKPFLLDRAFVNYNPHQFKPLTLIGGKFAYPWYRTELTWDNDLNPEGVAQKLEWTPESWHVLKQIAFIGFELPFAETSGINFNLPNPNNRSIQQNDVYGGQIQTTWQLASWLKFTADTAFYNYHNADPIALSAVEANASSPAVGLLKQGGNSIQNSYQAVTASFTVPVISGGTTTVGSAIINARFASKFALSDSIAQFDIQTHTDAWPIRLLGDYVQNTRACANTSQPIFVPAEPANANISISTVNGACHSRERRGYWLEGRIGRAQEKGDWQFAYTRMFIEREAVLTAFNFSDIRQGSNVTQHRLETLYTPVKNVQLGFVGFFGRPLNLGNSAPPENLLKRLQFDLSYKF